MQPELPTDYRQMKKQGEKRLADRRPPPPSNPRGDVGD
jgi:hypothetical protein